METPIEKLRNRSQENWLLDYESLDFLSLTEKFYQKFDNSIPQKTLLVEPEPILFLASFIAAYSRDHHVFLGNPAWGLFE
ncbi:MAG: hypothetical protein SAL70_14205 [Scytonema sp. PMC 1070.18]|nr:hypothetical protein [Scytonema sp. PMC 1070.18]